MSMRNILTLLVLFVFSNVSLFSGDNAFVVPPLATVTHLLPGCGEAGGEIEITLDGDPNLFTYWWEHDPEETSLYLTDLAAGTYIFHVRDFYGCEETIIVEMIVVDKISVETIVTPGLAKCTVDVEVIVRDYYTGELLDPAFFLCIWLDTHPLPVGFTRTFILTQEDQTLGFVVAAVYNNGQTLENCTSELGSVTIPGDEECKPRELAKIPTVMVNETKADARGQYVELLVLGEMECGATTDLRGYVVDDNNGQLVPPSDDFQPSDFGSANNGMNPGYLQFQYHENWAAVPNGSLILIYQDGLQGFPLTDDPSDANEDGVYVLAASNTNLLYGKTTEWNAAGAFFDYSGGSFAAPAWGAIQLSSPADGMQVRNPDGTFSHGFSLGENSPGTVNEFPLSLNLGDLSQAGCQFVQTDIWDKEHYECDFSSEITGTPGLPNSVDNEQLILGLTQCEPPIKALQGQYHSEAIQNKWPLPNNFLLYPNPFTGQFKINYTSEKAGLTRLQIISPTGSLVDELAINTTLGDNVELYKPVSPLPSGVYLLKLTLPSGEQLQLRAVCIKN